MIHMVEPLLKDDYTLASCCRPTTADEIVGYYSYNNVLKVHRDDCPNLRKADTARLVKLNWPDILTEHELFSPDADYDRLDEVDFAILEHHFQYGVDYSLVVARKANIPKQTAFDRHKKLRQMNLIERVEPRIIQYRKGIVDNKWIKHRNHTYYDLTDKGRQYLEYFLKQQKSQDR